MDPGAIVTVTLSATVLDDAKDVSLVVVTPPGWNVVGAGSWAQGDLDRRARPSAGALLRAPDRSPEGRPSFDAALTGRLIGAGGVIDTAAVGLRVAPKLIVEHVTFARDADITPEATYLAASAALDGVSRYDVFRIRFQVRNADLVPVTLSPTLQWSTAGSSGFADVPVGGQRRNVPLYVGDEWRPTPDGSSTLPGPDSEAIAAADVRRPRPGRRDAAARSWRAPDGRLAGRLRSPSRGTRIPRSSSR